MNITEIYNMKVNMGLLDLKKYNNLINEIENVPQKYIDVFDLKNIGNKPIKVEIPAIKVIKKAILISLILSPINYMKKELFYIKKYIKS